MSIARGKYQPYIRIFSLCLALILLYLSATGAAAQTADAAEKIVIAFAPSWPMPDLLTEKFFHPFENEHPDVDVVVVDPPEFPYLRGREGIEPLDLIAAYAGTADVFTVGSGMVTPIETRAGLVLDLQPFIAADETLNMAETFYPKVADAFRWDGGNWAMPASWNLALMGYHRGSFDEANLPYPQPDWSWETFAETMQALSSATGSASVIAHPWLFPPSYAVASLAGVPLADSDSMPQFDQAALRIAWEQWESAQAASWMVNEEDLDFAEDFPVILANYHLSDSGNNREYTHTTLPGGHTILETGGFAVSSATTHPEIAYALTKYLSRQLELLVNHGSYLPARTDLYAAADTLVWFENIDTVRKDLEKLLHYALQPADVLYLRSLYAGPVEGEPAPVDSAEGQRNAQQRLLDNLAEAAEYDAQIAIEKPESDFAPVHGPTIRFGLINRWRLSEKPLKEFAAEYARGHAAVGEIKIRSWSASPNLLVEAFDCFYGDQKSLAEMPVSSIIRLERLTEGDGDFQRESFLPGMLEKAQYQDVLWGYPISLHPLALRYHPAAFEASDLKPPPDWDADDFERALRQLWDDREDDKAVFGRGYAEGSHYLLLLIAAYSGLPVDTRSNPATYDLTAPANMEAIARALDLAREGIMSYQQLGGQSYSIGPAGETAIFPDAFSMDMDPKYRSYKLISFPQARGQGYLSYSLGLGYISANTPYRQACYDWISALAQRPDLFGGLPARTGLSNSDELTAAIAANGPAFFQNYVAQLKSEGTIILPEREYWDYEMRWLNQAFDKYVLEGLPLAEALEQAEAKLESYRECIGDSSYARSYECAEKIAAQDDD